MAGRPLTADVLPGLREWLAFNLAEGCTVPDLREALIASGYRARDVERFLATEARAAGTAYDAEPGNPDELIGRFWDRSDLLATLNRVALGDRSAPILARNPRLGLYYVADFLSAAECDGLVAAVEGRMARSAIIDEGDGATVKIAGRTSRGAAIPRGGDAIVRAIESRIARLTALPLAHGEDLQVLHYRVGGRYLPHLDAFDPATPGGARLLERNSQRLATVILYLSDVEGGGGTLFPELPLEVLPQKGAALLFGSLGRDGAVLPASLHAGCPVTSGEKWIATKWLRLTPQGAPE